jgi:hypothetical protein
MLSSSTSCQGSVREGSVPGLDRTGRWRTFQRGVEHEAANANKKVPKIGDGEDGVVAMLSAAFDAFVCKIQEQ